MRSPNMRKPLSTQTSRRSRRQPVQASRPDGRHAPGARARVARRRAPEARKAPAVVLDMPDVIPVTGRELDAVEQHLADELDQLLG